jgi:hypothetical protein
MAVLLDLLVTVALVGEVVQVVMLLLRVLQVVLQVVALVLNEGVTVVLHILVA